MPTNPELAIIIPCYNCAATLRAAVDSVYAQGLEFPFEVICVDDGSWDQTREILAQLQSQHRNLVVITNAQNLGGGAARNLAISRSQSPLFFSHDSDNLMVPGTLVRLRAHLHEHHCDGVAIAERRFFINSRFLYSKFTNVVPDNIITLDLLIAGKQLLIDNFMCTKRAWKQVGGYPEHHDFDTQGFEMRFLAAGCKLELCPGTAIFHRQAATHKSYFERVYEQGLLSINAYLIYEEIFPWLSDTVIEQIIKYDVFANAELMGANLSALVAELHLTLGKQFWRSPTAIETVANIREAVAAYLLGHDRQAIEAYLCCLAEGLDTPLVYFNLLRAQTRLSPHASWRESERCALQLLGSLQLHPQRSTIRAPWPLKIIKRLMHSSRALTHQK